MHRFFAITICVSDIPYSHTDVASIDESQLIGLTAPNTVAVSSCCREPDLLLHHKRVEGDRTRRGFLSPALELFDRIKLPNRSRNCSPRSLAHRGAASGQRAEGLASQWAGRRPAALPRIRPRRECALPCMRGRAPGPSAVERERRKGCYLSSICSNGRLEPARSAP